MQGLKCQSCKDITSQFTILWCDHIVCKQCLYGEIKNSLQGSEIKCSCGEVTIFKGTQKHSISSKGTVPISPRRESRKKLRTETDYSSVKHPLQSSKRSRVNLEDRPQDQLHSQLYFLGVQFRKSIEEAERNFKRVLQSIRFKYDNLVRNIKYFWFEEVVQNKPLALLELPKLLQKKYVKNVGNSLKNLNQSLFQQLAFFRVETQPERAISCKNFIKTQTLLDEIVQKQNRAPNRYQFQRKKLIQAIEQLKQGKGIRKGVRKIRPTFERY